MSSKMTDEEFREFLEESKERVKAFLKEEGPEFVEYAKDEAKKGAKKVKAKVKDKIDEKTDGDLKKIKEAFMDKDVQMHFMRMGMELFLGFSALISAMPKPEFVEKMKNETSDMRETIAEECCKHNPKCPKKKKSSPKKIELD